MCKFLLTGCMQNICNNQFANLVLSVSLYIFRKAKNDQNLITESGSRQRFSLLQEKVVIQAVCLKPGFRPKGGAMGIQENSENLNSLRPILFELCKKNYRGGIIAPPPSRNRVKKLSPTVVFLFHSFMYLNALNPVS